MTHNLSSSDNEAGSVLVTNLPTRHRIGNFWKGVLFTSTVIGCLALAILALSILNQTFGYVIVENAVDPATLSTQSLDTLSKGPL